MNRRFFSYGKIQLIAAIFLLIAILIIKSKSANEASTFNNNNATILDIVENYYEEIKN